MRPIHILLPAALLCGIVCTGQPRFDDYFIDKSLRIDFALNGNAEHQTAALQQVREEPVWGGPVRNLIDDFGYGGYYVNIYDRETGALIYSRGFNTLFEEWRATEEALTETQSWTTSVSVPYPKSSVTAEITARDKKDMQLHPILRTEIDPASIFIDRGRLTEHPVTRVRYEGDPHEKIDMVFLAEGYTADEQEKFLRDVETFADTLFGTPPFSTCRSDFNIWAVGLVSEERGTDVSGKGIYRNTALNSGFYTFGEERYLTTRDVKSIRDAVWNVPCDAIYILVNTEIYGGGGMYNFYAIGAADNEQTLHIFVHELGHSFAGLADEYFYPDNTFEEYYSLRCEPWEPNITTRVDFGSKWQDLMPEGVPVPTPAESEYSDGVGLFEGGGYSARGIFRPADHCMMRDYAPFCPVCSRSILRMIDFLTDREYR